MNFRPSCAALILLACGFGLGACAKENAAAADAASPASTAPAVTVTDGATGPTGDPCALNTDEEVRESFADAKAGKRDHSLDQYDIATCTWDTPTNTFVVQIFKAKGSVESELRSRASGSIDPVKPGAGKHVRYEKFPGVGDDAMLVAEKATADEGLFNDIVVLVVRKGDRMAVLFAHSLIDGNRTQTLAEMAALGNLAAKRL